MLTVKQAAIRLGVSASRTYELVERREIAHYRVGTKILLSEDDVAAYLESCRVEPERKAPGSPVGLFRQLNAGKLAEAWKRQNGSAPQR